MFNNKLMRYEMYKNDDFYLILMNKPSTEKYYFEMLSTWDEKFYVIEIWINFSTLSSLENRYYDTFFNKNFMTLKNLSEKYSFDYFNYTFFDEVITKLIRSDKKNYHMHASIIIKYFIIKRIEQYQIYFFMYIIALESEQRKKS